MVVQVSYELRCFAGVERYRRIADAYGPCAAASAFTYLKALGTVLFRTHG
jgi:hypothetical protein